VTQTPLTRSKGQGHQATLLTTALTRKVGAAVTVRKYWACRLGGNYCYVASARWRVRRLGVHEGRRGAGHIVAAFHLHLVT